MSKLKILVCGASGFIGRNVFEAFSADNNLEVCGTYFSRKLLDDPRLIKADLTFLAHVREVMASQDIVIHCAAVTNGSTTVTQDPAKYISPNVIMNTLLAEEAFRAGVSHFIFLSCTVMYPPGNDRPASEDDSIDLLAAHPKYFGGATVKLFGEQLCAYYSKLGKTMYTAIRHSNIYGPWDKFDGRGHITATLIGRAVRGEKITIRSDGSETRDLLYVDDLIAFIKKCLFLHQQRDKFEIYNVGSGSQVSLLDLAKEIVRTTGRSYEDIEVLGDSTLGIQTFNSLNIGKAQKTFLIPQTRLTAGLINTVKWYRNQLRNQEKAHA